MKYVFINRNISVLSSSDILDSKSKKLLDSLLERLPHSKSKKLSNIYQYVCNLYSDLSEFLIRPYVSLSARSKKEDTIYYAFYFALKSDKIKNIRTLKSIIGYPQGINLIKYKGSSFYLMYDKESVSVSNIDPKKFYSLTNFRIITF